ncbi:hypothetical protein [Thermoproteus tenax]|uniref:Uncharacterized protein n=1 Tax=Thermoproteus tenax (strain ATCC 35583 / DSM 2078 / JCM 9277 / NBRC 100435 / Kra 1) TaxID=768679 RepID=G4RJT7_THETK|nr:hypothetical protein [Thermoproteus tenax]CCC81832.1 hypothetical protein TTX_1192 [Thermoproteus tenax Kra 1]
MAYELDFYAAKILEIIADEEVRGAHGITPYQIMRRLEAYPSFLYKNVKNLERRGLIACTRGSRGRLCSVTISGLLAYLKNGGDPDKYVRLFFRKLGFESLPVAPDEAKNILRLLVNDSAIPRDLNDLFTWALLYCKYYFVTKFLRALSTLLDIRVVVTPQRVYVKRGNIEVCSCEKRSCDECRVRALLNS